MKLLLLGLLLCGIAGAASSDETQRLTIWKALGTADVRAMKIADSTYPECAGGTVAQMNQHARLYEQLDKKFYQTILRKYKITYDQLTDLQFEGNAKK